jgi:endonuclease YncB( thermonuclease family)
VRTRLSIPFLGSVQEQGLVLQSPFTVAACVRVKTSGGTMRWTRSCWGLFLALLIGCGGGDALQGPCIGDAGSAVLVGTVTEVIDGDTLLVKSSTGLERVRLDGIDAPELGQAGGPAAHQDLAHGSLQQTVQVAHRQRDRYGRLLGQVFLAQCQDLNLQLLRTGMAWFYKAYACDLDAPRRSTYAQAQAEAQAGRMGLWQQSQPMPPWVFRNGEDPPMPVCSH